MDDRLLICEVSADNGVTWTKQWMSFSEIDGHRRLGYEVRLKPGAYPLETKE